MRFTKKSVAETSSGISPDDPEKRYPYETTDHAVVYDDDLGLPALEHTTEAKLVAKIDWKVIPMLTILYLLAFLDRVNIANGQVFGLSKDLGLKGFEYNTALVIFFVPYVLFEIPSNVLLKRFRPHVWLSGCMFLFGLICICQGLVTSYHGLLAARFFLGLAESGMFPGCFYLISMWYRRSEAQRRITFFFSSATLAGAFGGLLAAAIGKMSGLRGYSGWRWIFILEGTLTCVVAIICFFVISDFPEDATWLTEPERSYVKARLRIDQGRSAVERKITVRDVGNVFKDFKIILGGLMYFGMIVPAYGYAYFSPSIINGYGYGMIETQLHSVPPWAAAWVFAMTVAYVSDKTRHRGSFAIGCIAIAIAGLGILIAVHNHRPTQYAALFLVCLGTYSALPITVCWFVVNVGGHHRRAVASAWQIGFGNVGGIIAVFAFLAKDAPKYIPGYSISVAFCCLSILACSAYWIACRMQNRHRDKQPMPVGEQAEAEQAELGDLAVSYRYML